MEKMLAFRSGFLIAFGITKSTAFCLIFFENLLNFRQKGLNLKHLAAPLFIKKLCQKKIYHTETTTTNLPSRGIQDFTVAPTKKNRDRSKKRVPLGKDRQPAPRSWVPWSRLRSPPHPTGCSGRTLGAGCLVLSSWPLWYERVSPGASLPSGKKKKTFAYHFLRC